MAQGLPVVRRESLHDQVLRHLGLRILNDDSEQGTKAWTTEAELSSRLKVSRTVLRESIKVLRAKGLVEVRPKLGVRARPRSDWNLLDPHVLSWQSEAGLSEPFIRNLCEIRRIIEPAAAELAAIRATTDEIAALDKACRQMEDTVENEKAFLVADLQFHSALFNACRNDLFEQMTGMIGKALRACGDIATQLRLSTVAALPLYREVVEDIRNHNAGAARSAMDRAVSRAARDIFQLLHMDASDFIKDSALD
jgi:DNA-binding FadR family transcriptional regulator